MPKMREVKRSNKNTKNNEAAKPVLVPIEMNGQIVMMQVCQPVPAPKGVTARC